MSDLFSVFYSHFSFYPEAICGLVKHSGFVGTILWYLSVLSSPSRPEDIMDAGPLSMEGRGVDSAVWSSCHAHTVCL